ncbi:uncharacterized protein LOC124157093 [Ischnura elegans]|uniref:uncharacterized protein LOC124157093 n=1 Tax=Ischnura elegans TaxID=197161 RepID=UPI001ED88AC0|nr:uncharacterized protein LOC124157093 [Ischnura elegans]
MDHWKRRTSAVFTILAFLLNNGRTQVAWTPIYVDGNSQVDLWTVSDTGCSCPREAVTSKHTPSSAAARKYGTTSATASTVNVTASLTDNPSSSDCACCVKDGGCPCGPASPRRCTQCGLESHCTQMCNVTLDSRVLRSRSGKTFGQIKSPSLVGPGSCWYLLLADRNQRIEIQVYRLVSVGHFNGTSCHAGFLELIEGPDAAGKKDKGRRGGGVIMEGPPRGGSGRGLQLCGENERFAPPAVVFADRTSATLLFQVGERTLRSQFLAYFSFTPADHFSLGIANRGGKRVEHTECDWVYLEHLCKTKPVKGTGGTGKGGRGKAKGGFEDGARGNDAGGCVLASPGYPGVYPPNRVCKYLVTTSSSRTHVNLTFTSLLMPYNHCDTDFIVIHKGSTLASPVLTKICGTRKTQLEFSGPNMLIEFRSGPPVPPYDYNGFTAKLEFNELPEEFPATELPISSTTKSAESGILMDETGNIPSRRPNTLCDFVYHGNATRSGQFDTRNKGLQVPSAPGVSTVAVPITCKLEFHGRSSDIVYMSLFNFNLRAPTCESFIEIFDGVLDESSKCIEKICSPSIRNAEDRPRSISEHKSIVSTGNILTIVFHKTIDSSSEFIEGAFLFHDERLDGSLKPSTLCDVVYDGAKRRGREAKKEEPLTEPIAGRSHQFLRYVEGPLRCSQRFDVEKGQTITLKITSGERLTYDPHCNTRCQTENGGGGIMDEDIGGGCSCMTNSIPL